MMEVWKDIDNWPEYQISSTGNIFSKKSNKIMATEKMKLGYIRVQLSQKGASKKMLVHVLVALAFLERPFGVFEINHKNGIKSDNRADNLEWVTKSQNISHSYRVVGRKKAIQPNKKKIIQLLNGTPVATHESIHAAAKCVSTSPGNISEACNGRYKSIKGYQWSYDKD